MASLLTPSPKLEEDRGGGAIRRLQPLAGLLLALTALALILFALLIQQVSAWPDSAPLRAALAATTPITPSTTTRAAPVVLLIASDVRTSDRSSLALDKLSAASWQLEGKALPSGGYLVSLLDGSFQTSPLRPSPLFSAADVLQRPLSGTLAGLTERSVVVNFQPRINSADSGTVWRVEYDVRSSQYDLIIALLPGLAGCHQATISCQNLASQQGSDIRQTATATASVNGTLIVAGDYEPPDASDDFIAQQTATSSPMLLFSGPQIKAGSYGNASLSDVAPTVAALLGVAPPVVSEGQILLPMLNLSLPNRAVAEYNLAAQHTRLAEAEAALSHQSASLIASIRANLEAAAVAIRVPDYPSALDLSSRAFAAADQELADVRQSAATAAAWPRLPLLLLAIAILLAVIFRWWRQLGYIRPILFYLALAFTALLLQIGLLYLLAPPIDVEFATLPDDWLSPTAYVFTVLGIAFIAQLVLGVAATLLYRRAYYRRPPTPTDAEDDQIAIWKLRVVQPLSPPLLWQAAYTAAFTLLALLCLIAAAIFWQYGFVSTFPPPSRLATLLLFDTFALIAANSFLAIFVTPLISIATYRLTNRRKPHPALTGQLVQEEPEALPYRRHRW